jgi:hypothetical protein
MDKTGKGLQVSVMAACPFCGTNLIKEPTNGGEPKIKLMFGDQGHLSECPKVGHREGGECPACNEDLGNTERLSDHVARYCHSPEVRAVRAVTEPGILKDATLQFI